MAVRDRDFLYGKEDNDTLLGGLGNDKLNGGSGNDTFVFNTYVAFDLDSIGTDTIVDFGDGSDIISLDKTTFTSLSSSAGSGFSDTKEFAVVSEDSLAASSEALVVFSSGTGNLFYNQNGMNADFGSGGHFATLENTSSLLAENFYITD